MQVHPKVIELLKNRGHQSHQEIESFFSWDLKELKQLDQLKDLDKAASLVSRAIKDNQKIAVFGDYDVDGTTSCALLHFFFKMIGVEINCIQPSRFVEGYGLHLENIEKCCELGVKLLITVDCGITSFEAAEYAYEKGIELIITDHHQVAGDSMPRAAAIINPNRLDEKHPELKGLAGVGVAFCLAIKIKALLEQEGRVIPSLYPLLQFVALGTVCDLAPINNYNRRLIRHGLKQMLQTEFEGIKTFFTPDERKRGNVLSEKLSFQIGPMINSKGRLDHPEYALKALISENHEDAFKYYSHLQTCNNERKFIQSQVLKEAKEQVLREDLSNHLISIVYKADWHEGVIGIVASRLVEEFKVPALVFTNSSEEGVIKASARSAGELNIYELLSEFKDLFLKFGGHHKAAGLSMPESNLETFKQQVKSHLIQVPRILRIKELDYDLKIQATDITPSLVKNLELLEPYGGSNPKPIFSCQDLHLEAFTILKEVHVRWEFSSKKDPKLKLKGISFNYVSRFEAIHPDQVLEHQRNGDQLEFLFELGINYFRGNEFTQLQILEIRSS